MYLSFLVLSTNDIATRSKRFLLRDHPEEKLFTPQDRAREVRKILVHDLEFDCCIQVPHVYDPIHSWKFLLIFQVYTWGDKENGVVGHTNANGHQYLPRVLDSLHTKTVKQVAACGFHTAALTDAGEIYTWGEGKDEEHGR